LTHEEKIKLGVTRLLPTSLKEALGELEKDREWIEGALGKNYINLFLILKRKEMEKLAQLGVDERKMLLIQYF
jgi:glutamine synthetase